MKQLFVMLLVFVSTALKTFAATYYVSIAGLGGAPEYEKQFADWNNELVQLLHANDPAAHVEALQSNRATAEALKQAIKKAGSEIHEEDAFVLMIMGHGSFDGTNYKFNVPGPDVTADDLAEWLNQVPAHRQLVVNMTSASGASLKALARKNRVVITATKTGTEKNATVFAKYWIQSLRDPAADVNKNGAVSAMEAYRYTAAKTAAYFQGEKLLASEHPLLSDTGAEGVRDPKPGSGQGLLATAFPLLPPKQAGSGVAVAEASNDPMKKTLLVKKQDLNARIDRLKYRKTTMATDDYKRELTTLLVDLAHTQAEIDR